MLLFFPHKNPLGKFMKNMIRDVIDFPKNGVVFKDIFPLLQNSFHFVIDELAQLIESPKKIDVIAGIESRGFIFAAALAYKLNKGFVPIRKKGKLPPPVLQQKIILEYGEAELEMCEGKGKMIIIDDVLATGGTLQGAWILAKKCGYFPFQVITLIDIKGLHEKNLGFPYSSVFDYE
jgi:adenine phosphoribosyltransferase